MQPKAMTGKGQRPSAAGAEPANENPTNVDALSERIVGERTRAQKSDPSTVTGRLAKLREVVRRFDALPVLDSREPDEIIGYDEKGLPR